VRKIFTTRRRIVIAGASTAVLVAAGGGAAFAYFASTGSGTGSATVGSVGTNDWAVTQTSSTGTLFPVPAGSDATTIATDSATITFTVKNNGTSPEEFTNAKATIESVNGAASGDAETGTPPADIPNCTSGWFSATVASDPSANTQIPAGQSATVTVTVTMNDSGTNQDGCEGKTPNVDLAIS
jgi:hypothetical protein